jgi:predicted ATP-grasp superfamily ATP-dependent carboligase
MTQTLDPQVHRPAKPIPPTRKIIDTPPAIILGGRANALSVARSLGRMGVVVYAINTPDAFVRHSRFSRWLDVPVLRKAGEVAAWAEFLLSPAANHLHGAVLLACCDQGIELLVRHRKALEERYLLDESTPHAQLCMLNKLSTYEQAVAAGVPTPKFWLVDSPKQLEDVRKELVFPLIVKPRLGHMFELKSGRKLIVARHFDELAPAVRTIASTGTSSMLVEMIPGPDSLLCSYFTYLDEDSEPLFQFTKRVIRRCPALTGTGCYAITDWNPEAAELGDRLFRYVGLRGLANVEFKRDPRDGQLKLIECNARFTASQALIVRSGFDLAKFTYNRITGRPLPLMRDYTIGRRLWDPIRDFQAFLEQRRTGEINFPQWVRSIMHRQMFPYFEWSDPAPALARITLPLRKRLGLVQRAWAS